MRVVTAKVVLVLPDADKGKEKDLLYELLEKGFDGDGLDARVWRSDYVMTGIETHDWDDPIHMPDGKFEREHPMEYEAAVEFTLGQEAVWEEEAGSVIEKLCEGQEYKEPEAK